MARARVWWWTVLLSVAVQGAGFAPPPRPDKPIVAMAPDYRVSADLSNVSNAKQLPTLTAAQRQALGGQGFFAQTTPDEQLYAIYENNEYRRLPSFVTTDSVLHTWHIFYDFVLRWLEASRLRDNCLRFCERMYELNLAGYRADHTPAVHQAFGANLIDFAVALTQLGQKPELPAELRALHERFCGFIAAHDGPHVLAPAGRDVGVRVDFTQFIVRGHYTRTPELGQYFRAMMWLGLVPRPLGPGVPECTVRSLLLTHQLVGDDEARGLWRRVYEPTAFMVGVADDLTHEDLQPFLRRCFDPERIDSFGEQERLEAFWKLTPTMRQQGIEAGPISYKIMGQRFILDSRVFRETVAPRTGRGFPLGLDVPAVLGSARAIGLLDDLYQQPKFDGYATQRAKMRAEVVALSPSDWDQNLYYGWLRALQPLLEPKGPGWPRFMQSPAWLDKQLVCFLGSWTELRHDTILYAKQSTSECGGSEPEPPAPPLGYVEPEVAVYERLARLLRMSRDGLADLGLLGKKGGGDDNAYTGQQLAEQFGEFATMLDWLAEVSRKELAGQPLSKDDLRGIEYYGGQTERLMLTVVGLATTGRPASYWNLESRADRNMALVADVHTSGPYALTEAVGQPAELWVIVNHGGKLVAARGATFTWYEFKVKTTERMTDEQWQKRLRDGKAEPMPSWTSSVFIGPGVKTRTTETERRIMNTGC